MVAHAEIEGASNGNISESLSFKKSAEPSLAQLYACAEKSSPGIMAINKGSALVSWIPADKDKFYDDGSGLKAVSLWAPAGKASAKSGFITFTDKQILFTPAEVNKGDPEVYGDTKYVDLSMEASSVPIPKTFGLHELRRFSLNRAGEGYSQRSFTKPEDNRSVRIRDEDIVLGEEAAKAQKAIKELLKARIERSATVLKDYSALLSKSDDVYENDVELTMAGGRTMVIPRRKRTTELSSTDVAKYRAAYCACEVAFPEEVKAARKSLTSVRAPRMPMNDNGMKRTVDSSDFDCGSH